MLMLSPGLTSMMPSPDVTLPGAKRVICVPLKTPVFAPVSVRVTTSVSPLPEADTCAVSTFVVSLFKSASVTLMLIEAPSWT
jgi:hypothetical protein